MTDSVTDTLLTDRVRGVLDVPLHRFLGMRLRDPAHPQHGLAVEVADAAVNNVDLLHGGIVAALLDVAGYLALLPELGPDVGAVTHDASVSLIKAVPRGALVEVTGRVVRRGRNLAFVQSEATVDGVVVAIGQVTKSVLRT